MATPSRIAVDEKEIAVDVEKKWFTPRPTQSQNIC